MKEFLFLALGFLIGVIFAKYWLGKGKSRVEEKEKPEKLIDRQEREKKEHMRRVVEFVATKQRVANQDIERLLGVSDATATRYLEELEKSGYIRQVGTTGQSVYYQKTGK